MCTGLTASFCIQEPLLTGSGDHIGLPGIKSGAAACMEIALHVVILLQLLVDNVYKSIGVTLTKQNFKDGEKSYTYIQH